MGIRHLSSAVCIPSLLRGEHMDFAVSGRALCLKRRHMHARGEILSGKLKVVPVVPTRRTFLSGLVTCCLARSLRDENGAVLLSEYIA